MAGVLLIGIGLLWGGSVFRGDFTRWPIFFDGAGIYFLVRGLVSMARARNARLR